MNKTSYRLVWDLPVRLTHWLLVAAVLGSWVTSKLNPQYFPWHVACGYVVLVLASFRILWGFLGTRHARFASFLRGPAGLLTYARTVFRPNLDGVTGHNPLGGLAIVLMLTLLFCQAVSGLFSNDDIENVGPLFGWVSDASSKRFTSLHHLVYDALLALIALHLAAVLFYTFYKRASLIRPMFTGRKSLESVPESQQISDSRLGVAAALLVLLIVTLWWVVRSAPPATLSPF